MNSAQDSTGVQGSIGKPYNGEVGQTAAKGGVDPKIKETFINHKLPGSNEVKEEMEFKLKRKESGLIRLLRLLKNKKGMTEEQFLKGEIKTQQVAIKWGHVQIALGNFLGKASGFRVGDETYYKGVNISGDAWYREQNAIKKLNIIKK